MKNRRAQFYRFIYRSFYALGTALLLTGLLLSVAASPADAGFRGIKITSTSRPRDGGDLPRRQQNSLPGVQSQRPQVQGEASPRRQAQELATGNTVTILAQQASVSFTSGDTALCQLTPTTVEATAVVSLPEGVEVILQTAFRVVNPPDRRTDTTYSTHGVKNGDRVTFSGQWPGVRPGDQVVEIHFGAILLSPAGNPISSGAGLDYFWYPYVCSPPTVVVPNTATATPTASSTATQPAGTSTGTATATYTLTPTQPQDPTETNTSTVTPTQPQDPTETNTSTVTPTQPQDPTSTSTLTPTQPQSSTSTNTPTNTTTPPTVQVTVPSSTFTVTPTATNTITATHTATQTSTATVTLTPDPSATSTSTVTSTQLPTVQVTRPTATRTPTASSTATNTPTATFVVFTVTATPPPTLTNTVRVGVGIPSGTPSITPPPTLTPDPGSPTAGVPVTGGSGATSTPVPSVAPPQISAGSTEQVVPVTGAGVTRPTAIPLNSLLFWQRLSTYLGLLVFGLAIFLHGLERRL